jgi:hypothetical protein
MSRILLALLLPLVLLLGCRSAPPAPPRAPDFASCPDLAGSFLFVDLATSCKLTGRKGEFPTYAIPENGRYRGPRDRGEILPLPLYHWADPDTRLKIEPQGCSRLALSLYDAGPSSTPYYAYEIDLQDLARHGTLEMSPSRLSFASSGDWEVAQIPLFGIGRRREGWSLARDAQGRLVFSQSLRTMSAMFWVIPVPSRAEVSCVLAPAP